MKKTLIIIGGVLATLFVLALMAVFMMAPTVADEVIQSRVAKLKERTGWTIDYADLKTSGLGGVVIENLAIKDEGESFLTIAKIDATADVASLMSGEKRLSSLSISGVNFILKVDADGNIIPLNDLRSKSEGTKEESSGGGGLAARLAKLPSVDLTDATVTLVSLEGAPALPLKAIKVPTARMETSSSGFDFSGKATIDANEIEGIQLPTTLDGTLSLDPNLRPKAGKLAFDRPLAVSGLSPLPFLVAGLSGAEVNEDGVLVAQDVSVEVVGDPNKRLFKADSIGFALDGLPTSLESFRIVEVSATAPVLYLDYNKAGASSLNDVFVALQAPAADSIVAGAKRFAEKRASRLKVEPLEEEEADEVEEQKGPSRLDRIEALLKRWAPQVVRIHNAQVVSVDERSLALDRQVRDLSMQNASLTIEHELGANRVVIDGQFDAMGDGAALGKARAKLDADYGKMSVSGEVELDAIDLSWAGQLLGQRVRNLIGGGTLRAKVKIQSQGEKAFGVNGMVSVDDLTVTAPFVAEEPIKNVTSSYQFSAKYSALRPMPKPTLLEVPVYEEPKVVEGEPPPPAPPAPQGSLVFEAGTLRFNGVQGTFRPSLYGFNAPGRLPARLDLHVEIPNTDVMKLFNAIPSAVLGETAGTKMAGSLSWVMDVELPLYRASDMKWDSKTVLNEFEVISIPQPVDVRRLMERTKVTITDSIEEEDDFERTITLPAAKPIPAQWLIDHAGLTLEEIDERRREREWPPVPPAKQLGLAKSYVDSPTFWMSSAATNEQAQKPWNDGDPIVGVSEEQPYGKYVFVPLQYISAYMPKAVMTTEDNSFFTHDGFNRHALRASIERNIESGAFKRGASTIAMQMVKNVFLNRKKLISRKVQEAFLVFLMESAVNIPKYRIMEVYLNVIEFGPGIFGIHDAAVHYFGKRPDKLTLGEVAWFVSIIPNPKKYHFYYERRGAISDAWFNRMKRYIQVMYNRERISQEELDAALAAPPEFYKPAKDEPLLRPAPTPDLWAPLLDDDSPFNGLMPSNNQPNAPTPTPNPNGVTPPTGNTNNVPPPTL